jgi:hypothetical protein
MKVTGAETREVTRTRWGRVGVDAHLVRLVDGSGCGGSDASHLEDLGVGGGWGGEVASGETKECRHVA